MPFRVYVPLDDGGSISRLLPKRASMRQDIGECTFALLLEPPVLPSLGHLKAIPPCSAMLLHPTRISRKAFGAWCLMVSWCSLVVPPGGGLLVVSLCPQRGCSACRGWPWCSLDGLPVVSWWSPRGCLLVVCRGLLVVAGGLPRRLLELRPSKLFECRCTQSAPAAH